MAAVAVAAAAAALAAGARLLAAAAAAALATLRHLLFRYSRPARPTDTGLGACCHPATTFLRLEDCAGTVKPIIFLKARELNKQTRFPRPALLTCIWPAK
eukprot:12723949-Alexandrium_andersonii.AAC.1